MTSSTNFQKSKHENFYEIIKNHECEIFVLGTFLANGHYNKIIKFSKYYITKSIIICIDRISLIKLKYLFHVFVSSKVEAYVIICKASKKSCQINKEKFVLIKFFCRIINKYGKIRNETTILRRNINLRISEFFNQLNQYHILKR
ncbi:hypothetical protein BpHYR1_040647 [Brachionus plicatilis]|uniref:Uncharacterized protein n=1 Tax=Brachionus plicatilis TaxID=10195 RepID=A0A3M7QH40_BRAPC|nr:hypothetical protein BpHYR1_040647 [Brachionus plicatilis]